MKNCSVCRHRTDGSHDHCRTHAPCAVGVQYSSTECQVCNDLLDRASAIEDPLEARKAYKVLSDWVGGFARNSRNRPPGVDVFAYPEE